MLAEGGFHRIIPPRDPVGDQDLRTHPPGDPYWVTALNLPFLSSSRLHSMVNKQRKLNRNGLLWSAYYNISIAVTNRERSWNICRNNICEQLCS